jgi:hypothetical protein
MEDAVRVARARWARWGRLASRTGYLAWGVAIVLFVIGLATEFGDAIATAAATALILGCILLLPAIIIGYAVRAAEREDRERGL